MPAFPRAAAPAKQVRVTTLTDERAAKRLRAPADARQRAVSFFSGFLERFKDHSGLAAKMVIEHEPFDETSKSLCAVLEARKTATIMKRASSIRTFLAWFDSVGLEPALLLAERTVFDYLTFTNEQRCGATTGIAFLQSLNFVGGLFNMDVKAAVSSPRVRGLVVRLSRTAQPRRQRAPLSVAMLEFLEKVAYNDTDDLKGVIAGAAVFTCLARARVGDVRRCATEPTVDAVAGPREGYVQTFFAEHKTAKAGSRLSLPVVSPLFGVTGLNWAAAWLARRSRLGLCAAADGTLLPAPGPGGSWSRAPFTTFEYGLALRGLLRDGGFDADHLDSIGSHSLKITTLSWAAKAGIEKETRRTLGYHLRPGDAVMEAYSRDALAGPLRALTEMLNKVASGAFLPDATRSGSFPPPPPSSTCSASSASSSPSLAGSADEVDELPVEEDAMTIVQNKATKYVHLKGAGNKLACNKPFPLQSLELLAVPPGARLCRRCF